jgi:hypothetical protein
MLTYRQWLQLLRTIGHSHRLRNVALDHRYLPHAVYLDRVAWTWLGDIQVAASAWFCSVGIRHVLVQRLDQAAAEVLCGEEA